MISFLWGDLHNVDTDGNSYNPASLDWTELYCQNRENEQETFDVGPVSESPLTLKVESEMPELAAHGSLLSGFRSRRTRGLRSFLARGRSLRHCESRWAALISPPPSFVRTRVSGEATLDDPYPNLRGGRRAI